MPFRIGSFVSEDKAVAAPMQIAGLMLNAYQTSFLSDRTVVRLPLITGLTDEKSSCCDDPSARISTTKESSNLTTENHGCSVSGNNNEQKSGEENHFSFSQYMASENNKNNGDKSPPKLIDIMKNVQDSDVMVNNTWESTVALRPIGDVFAVAEDLDVEDGNGCDPKLSHMLLETPPQEKIIRTISGQRRSYLDAVPLWGLTSICGGRPEMEDAAAAVPCFQTIPTKMFMSNHELKGMCQDLSQTLHFYGVYDGHGGCQVANYCHERLHLALAEEIEVVKREYQSGCIDSNLQDLWEKVFHRCFLKVDAEVGRAQKCIAVGYDCASEADIEPIAPETVGSTAVVAIVCSTHIIVANSGDSRAVLFRGKTAMPLSVDHKPNRKDEWERIEAADGKVIQWNGFRVFGVLSMSRSIGDRYLKPWIIPDPELMFVPRSKEDDCLILASDGLWDVMSNEEACEAARRRILLWHKRNGAKVCEDRGRTVDPAAQAAAEHLSKLALQKGSKDNITVIVVDLKPHRKLKSKT
ncbi:hypothetical protein Nepgr_015586 [Nepenthes gracilis]|uniref:protein-serine/threonine phosphatase n=1 Tax=Nepenthes gracilis TaxID=150966 RepID=A0AAD3SLA8_NEPGR|nr:hypothetical protein Nepgr_015586 [Nepenthes gracilis]